MSDIKWERCGQQVGTTIRWVAKVPPFGLVAYESHGLPRPEPHRMRSGWSVYPDGQPFALADGHTNCFERAKACAEAVARIEGEDRDGEAK